MSQLTILTTLELTDYCEETYSTGDLVPLQALRVKELALVNCSKIYEDLFCPGALQDLQHLQVIEDDGKPDPLPSFEDKVQLVA